MASVVDMRGRTVGRLLVVDREENNKRGQARWRCVCECEKETVVLGTDLRSGNTVSCGCFQKETIEKQHERSFIHGHDRRGKTSKIYYAWKNARHWGKTQLDFPEFLQKFEAESCSPTLIGTNSVEV